MGYFKKFKMRTKYNDIVDITENVKSVLEESKIDEGICLVYTGHSTAAITTFSPWDPDGFLDLDHEIRRLVPTRIDFYHQHDTPQDAAGHIKSALFGVSESYIVKDNKLLIGGSQHIYFLEFDGPRDREYMVYIKD